MPPAAHVLVMAKAPVAGRVKTRLCPPCTPSEAAAVATAALADTLDAVAACAVERRIVALDGEPGPWLPPGFEVVPQVGSTFADRLQAAWDHAGGPGLQIGMDTPQVDAPLLEACLAPLLRADGPDAVLGPASDGGWWAIGFRSPPAGAFRGVPMSQPTTGRVQRQRLAELGLRVATLPELVDLDDVEAARAVADAAPGTRTALALRPLLEPTGRRS